MEVASRTIIDHAENTVKIPSNIERIGDTWPAHNAVLIALGAGDRLVAASPYVKNLPWLRKIFPRIDEIPAPFDSDSLNKESLTQTHPDIIICPLGYLERISSELKATGIPVIQLLHFDDYNQLKKLIILTGEILGGEVKKKANEYCKYVDDNIRRISSVTSKISVKQMPRVCFISSRSLNYYKNEALVQTWIEMGGGINVAAGEGRDNAFQDLSIKDVRKRDPEVIIVSSSAQSPEDIKQKILNDSQWSEIKAVRDGKVYISPRGVYTWDYHSTETALQILWISKTLHPDKFKDLNMVKEVKFFYSKFYCYNLTDDEANRILNNLPPPETAKEK